MYSKDIPKEIKMNKDNKILGDFCCFTFNKGINYNVTTCSLRIVECYRIRHFARYIKRVCLENKCMKNGMDKNKCLIGEEMEIKYNT
jgi:hypothetical protein